MGEPAPAAAVDLLLSVEELSVSFPARGGGRTLILDRVAFDVRRCETLALVGESGCGKTLTALSIVGLLDRGARLEGGRIRLDGRELLEMTEEQKHAHRGKLVGMIFQAPRASLNPLLKSGDQIARVVRLHRGLGRSDAKAAAVELMRAVGINDAPRRYHAYPHQLSGGMAQRVMIGIALAAEPELLIADEPTTGLDVTIQAQIFELLAELQQRLRMAILLITHDLAVVAETCERMAVMHAGHVVEVGPVGGVFDRPEHPYTQRLLGSLHASDASAAAAPPPEGVVFAGMGCRYVSKCEHAFGPCAGTRPALLPVGDTPGHIALCHLHDPRFSELRASNEPTAAGC